MMRTIGANHSPDLLQLFFSIIESDLADNMNSAYPAL